MALELTMNAMADNMRPWPTTAREAVAVAAPTTGLPHETQLKQRRRSGDACFATLAGRPIGELDWTNAPIVPLSIGAQNPPRSACEHVWRERWRPERVDHAMHVFSECRSPSGSSVCADASSPSKKRIGLPMRVEL